MTIIKEIVKNKKSKKSDVIDVEYEELD